MRCGSNVMKLWGLACCLATIVYGEQPAGYDTPTTIGVYALPDRVVSRTDEAIHAEYIQGMPICISVRLANHGVKKMRKNAKPIKLKSKWHDDVVIDVRNVKTGQEIKSLAKMVAFERKQESSDREIFLDRRDVVRSWLIDDDVVSSWGEGDYSILVRYGSQAAKPIMIRIKDASGNDASVRVHVRKALAFAKRGDLQRAILEAEAVMHENGRDAKDNESFAILIAADAYDKMGQYKKALKAYEEYLTIWKSRNLRGEPQKVIWHIDNLRKTLADESKGGLGVTH